MWSVFDLLTSPAVSSDKSSPLQHFNSNVLHIQQICKADSLLFLFCLKWNIRTTFFHHQYASVTISHLMELKSFSWEQEWNRQCIPTPDCISSSSHPHVKIYHNWTLMNTIFLFSRIKIPRLASSVQISRGWMSKICKHI